MLRLTLKLLFIYLPLLVVLFVFLANLSIVYTSKSKIYTDVKKIPHNKVGLVLGTTKILQNGRVNRYFKYRIDAAAKLYHAKKIDNILVSGDNKTHSYNECKDMKEALMAKGVPANKIYSDFAGFRTLDSVVRANKVFGQTKMTIVTQNFHNERAIFIADYFDLSAIGFNARDLSTKVGIKVQLREVLAKTKAVLDLYILKTAPKYLGPKVIIK